MNLKTPVALLMFNRADLTAQVFEAIRRAQPEKLFIVADGPRHVAERVKCEETRRVVQEVDWKCEVRRDYSDANLGCRKRVASGLDWVFSQAEQAIILEDDCVPSQSFFTFCSELLERYREEDKLMHICGSNFLSRGLTPHSYYFSKYSHVWGWATWRRAWRHFDLQMLNWPEFKKNGSKRVFSDPAERKHWIHKLTPVTTGERNDSWAYPWQFSVWAKRGLCVVPETNLVSNIGHREDATHTQSESARANLPAGELPKPLHHPPDLKIHEEADRRMFYEVLEGKRLLERRTWRYRLSKPLRLWRKLRNATS